MSAKIYLVTGSSRGIGLGLVRDLISRGHKVLAACRNPETATELKNLLKDNGQPEPVKCDVTSDQSVAECFKQVFVLNFFGWAILPGLFIFVYFTVSSQ